LRFPLPIGAPGVAGHRTATLNLADLTGFEHATQDPELIEQIES
jgi:hypothetical protein